MIDRTLAFDWRYTLAESDLPKSMRPLIRDLNQLIDGEHHNCEIFYDDVRVPLSNVVGGLKVVLIDHAGELVPRLAQDDAVRAFPATGTQTVGGQVCGERLTDRVVAGGDGQRRILPRELP